MAKNYFKWLPFEPIVSPLPLDWLSSINQWSKGWTWHTKGPLWLQYLLIPVYAIAYALVNLFVLLFGVLTSVYNIIVWVVSFAFWGINSLVSLIVTFCQFVFNFFYSYFANSFARFGATLIYFGVSALILFTDFVKYIQDFLAEQDPPSLDIPTDSNEGILWFFFNYLDFNHFASLFFDFVIFWFGLWFAAAIMLITYRVLRWVSSMFTKG